MANSFVFSLMEAKVTVFLCEVVTVTSILCSLRVFLNLQRQGRGYNALACWVCGNFHGILRFRMNRRSNKNAATLMKKIKSIEFELNLTMGIDEF